MIFLIAFDQISGFVVTNTIPLATTTTRPSSNNSVSSSSTISMIPPLNEAFDYAVSSSHATIMYIETQSSPCSSSSKLFDHVLRTVQDITNVEVSVLNGNLPNVLFHVNKHYIV